MTDDLIRMAATFGFMVGFVGLIFGAERLWRKR